MSDSPASSSSSPLSVLQPDAAGVDLGATEVFAAVAPDRTSEPVRRFSTFTADLIRLVDWLASLGIRTVALEATGVYWIPLVTLLEERGIEACLVNPRHVHHVPGRKTDVQDCQWLQQLHAAGLLQASFRPAAQVCALRALWRHREGLVQMAAQHVQHLEKALDQMNLQLHHVLSDITGTTGLAILDAIVAGERNPQVLAQLRDPHVKSSAETIAQALTGDWRGEHLFTLQQSLAAYRHYQRWLAEVDAEIQAQLRQIEPASQDEPPESTQPHTRKRQHNEPDFNLRRECFRWVGVDLTALPGFGVMTAYTVLTEVGPSLEQFRSSSAFCSWLGVCPNPQISGGRVLRRGTRKVKNRVACALRQAAQGLHRSRCAMGEYYRRMRSKLGAPKAITATAHKLARLLYHVLKHKKPYEAGYLERQREQGRQRQEAQVRKQAKKLGFALVPLTQPA